MLTRSIGALVVLLFLFNVGAARAGSAAVPAIPGARTVSAEEANAALRQGAVALDLRRPDAFMRSRLPEARAGWSAFDATTRRFDAGALTVDHMTPIVFYHEGPEGLMAYRAISAAVASGHSNVMWLRGGLNEWIARDLPLHVGPPRTQTSAILGNR